MKNKKIKNFLNKISSFVVILLILVIALFVVLYARGYNFDISNLSITSTGIIRVNTTPNNSQVYLNNKYVGNSPLVLNSINPGAYNIKVLKTNYTQWDSLVTVKSGNITNVDPFLLPTQVDQSIVKTAGNVYKVIYNRNSNYLYIIVVKNSIYKLYYLILSLITQGYKLNYVANLTKIIKFIGKYYITIECKSTIANIILQYNNKDYIYNIATNKLLSLSKIIYSNNFTNIKWADSSNYILLRNKNLLSVFNLSTNQTYLLSYTPNSSSGISYRVLSSSQIIFSLYSRSTNISNIFISNLNGTEKTLVYKITGDINNIFVNSEESYVAISVKGGNNYLLSLKNNILSHKIKFASQSKILTFNSQNNYILTEKNNTVYAYYINNLSKILVIDNYNQLHNLKLYSLGGYIFFQKKNPNSTTYSLYEQTIGLSTPVLLSKDTVGDYYISVGGDYLFFKYYYKNSTYLYAVTLIKNNNIFPFAL
jgi:hypothetical protein